MDSWLGQFGHDHDEAFLLGQHMGWVGFDACIFFPWCPSPVSHHTCNVPFPPRRSGEYRKGMIPARLLYQGVWGFGIPNPRESGSAIREDCRRSGPSCVLPKGVPQGQTESGGDYSTRRHMLGHERPEAVSPARGVVLTDLQ